MKLNKEQFFSKLVNGEIKSFSYNGVKFYSNTDYKKLALKYFRGNYYENQLLNTTFDKTFEKELFTFLKSTLIKLVDSNINHNGQGVRDLETQKEVENEHMLKWLNSLSLDKVNFSEARVFIKNSPIKPYMRHIYLLDTRNTYPMSFIDITIREKPGDELKVNSNVMNISGLLNPMNYYNHKPINFYYEVVKIPKNIVDSIENHWADNSK